MRPARSSTSQAPQTGAAAGERPSRGRAASAVVCLVLAALLTTPAAVAYWGQRTLNDTQRYVDTVQPLVDSPEVQDVLATTVTDAIQKQVDVETILNNVFASVVPDRPRLQQLVGPLTAAINGLIERQVREFFASDAFADIWTRANTRAQQTLHRLLEGDETGAIQLQGDEVVLDVSEVIDQVKARLVDRGLTFVANAPIPDTDRQIVLLQAPELRQLRTIYAFGNPVAKWALPFVALLYLLVVRPGPPQGPHDGGDRLRARGQRGVHRHRALGGPHAVRQPALGHRVRAGQQCLLRDDARLPPARSEGRALPGSLPHRRGLVRRRQQVRHGGAHRPS